jgi:cell division protease FtsH
MNESAILAARRNKKAISLCEINDATDRVVAGLEGRALKGDAQKKLFAYHEAGKVLVATLLPYHDPVAKVTLIPRGQQKSLTWFSPDQDQSLISASSLKARIAGFLGGRAAEQIVFGVDQVTSNAANDLQKVDQVARAMVTQVGMSSVGQIAIDQGGMMGPSYSEDLSGKIDSAIKELSDEGYLTALKIIIENRACLDKLADELFERETLTQAEVKEIVADFVGIPEKLAAV